MKKMLSLVTTTTSILTIVTGVSSMNPESKNIKVRFANFLGEEALLTYNLGATERPDNPRILKFKELSDYIARNTSKESIGYTIFANETRSTGKLILQESPETTDYYTIFVYSKLNSIGQEIKIGQLARKDQTKIKFPSKDIQSPLAIWRFLDLRSTPSDPPYDMRVYTMSTGCENCAWEINSQGDLSKGFYINATSVFSTKFKFVYKNHIGKNESREAQFRFRGRGVYSIVLRDEAVYMVEDKGGKEFYYPLVIVLLSGVLVLLGRMVFLKVREMSSYRAIVSPKKSVNVFTEQSENHENSFYSLTGTDLIESKTIISGFNRTDNPNPALMTKQRIGSVDILKGIGIAAMILAKAGGGNCLLLSYSPWEGITFGDLDEPFLVFSMGFCLTFACAKSQYPTKRWFLISVRSLMMVFLGLVYENETNNYEKMIFTGFLQRLGIAYFVLSGLEMVFPLEFSSQKKEILKNFYIKTVIMLLVPTLSILVVTFSKTGDCPRGYQGAGGLADGGKHEFCTGGIYRKIDLFLFGINHIPKNPSCKLITHCQEFDQYNLLGTLNFMFSGYLGSVAGSIHLRSHTFKQRVVSFFLLGVFLGFTYILFLSFHMTGIKDLPLNKNLWSLNFTVLSSFLAVLFLVVFTILLKWKRFDGWPFRQLAMNAIFVIFASKMLGNRFPFGFANDGDLVLMTVSNVMSVTVWFIIAIVLNVYKFYIKF